MVASCAVLYVATNKAYCKDCHESCGECLFLRRRLSPLTRPVRCPLFKRETRKRCCVCVAPDDGVADKIRWIMDFISTAWYFIDDTPKNNKSETRRRTRRRILAIWSNNRWLSWESYRTHDSWGLSENALIVTKKAGRGINPHGEWDWPFGMQQISWMLKKGLLFHHYPPPIDSWSRFKRLRRFKPNQLCHADRGFGQILKGMLFIPVDSILWSL